MGGVVFAAHAPCAEPACAWEIVKGKRKETAAPGGPVLQGADKSGAYMLQIYCPQYAMYDPDSVFYPFVQKVALVNLTAGAGQSSGAGGVSARQSPAENAAEAGNMTIRYSVIKRGGPVPFPRRGALHGETDKKGEFSTIYGADFVADAQDFSPDYPGVLQLSFPENFRSGKKIHISYNIDGLSHIYRDFRGECAAGRH